MPKDTLTVHDLKPDPHNRRARTKRGAAMLVESFEQLGPARSIVIDEDNTVLAGNGALLAAEEAGVKHVQVVEADGETLIAVRRRGLTPDEKRALALYDNRTGELAEWVPEQLGKDRSEGLSLMPWFDEADVRKLFKTGGKAAQSAAVKEIDTGPVADRFWIAVRGPLKAQADTLQRLRDVLKEIPDLEVELGLAPEVEAWTG